MPTQLPRVTITVSKETLTMIDDYKFDARCKNQTQAIVELITKGLDALEQREAKEAEAAAPAANDNLTSGENRLLNNYRQLNADGQERLTEHSEDMVASGRYRVAKKENAG